MKKLVCSLVSAAVLILSGGAVLAQSLACPADVSNADVAVLRACVKDLQQRLDRAWAIVGDGGTLIKSLPPEASTDPFISKDPVSVLHRWRRMLSEAARVDEGELIAALDRQFSAEGGDGLRVFYARHRSLILEVVRSRVLPSLEQGQLEKLRPLLEKPFDPLLGAAAYAWYSERCAPGTSCRSRAFVDGFKARYGIVPTEIDAYILNSLYVRFQHADANGEAYVRVIQQIGLEVLTDFAGTATARAEAGK